MAVGWKMTRQNPIFPPHSASIPVPSLFPSQIVLFPVLQEIWMARARIIGFNPCALLCEKSSEKFAVVKTFFIFTEELIFM